MFWTWLRPYSNFLFLGAAYKLTILLLLLYYYY